MIFCGLSAHFMGRFNKPFIPRRIQRLAMPIVTRLLKNGRMGHWGLSIRRDSIPTRLYFVGFFTFSGDANSSMMGRQSEWLAALASGMVAAPSRGRSCTPRWPLS